METLKNIQISIAMADQSYTRYQAVYFFVSPYREFMCIGSGLKRTMMNAMR